MSAFHFSIYFFFVHFCFHHTRKIKVEICEVNVILMRQRQRICVFLIIFMLCKAFSTRTISMGLKSISVSLNGYLVVCFDERATPDTRRKKIRIGFMKFIETEFSLHSTWISRYNIVHMNNYSYIQPFILCIQCNWDVRFSVSFRWNAHTNDV